MNITEKIAYWVDIAGYDLETARAMLTSGRYLYAVFMCQQAVEKLLKAAYMEFGSGGEPPRTHNLTFLLGKLELDKIPEEIELLASRLSAYYIETRYPNYKEKLSCLVDSSEAERTVNKTEDAFSWLQSQMK